MDIRLKKFKPEPDHDPRELFTKAISPFNHNNLTIKTKQGTLHVNKEQLMAASPVFHKMLTSDFREKNEEVIDLPDKNPITISHFLRHTLPGFDGLELTEKIARLILPLAHKYQCMDTLSKVDLKLANHCEKNKQQPDSLISYILDAEIYSLPKLLRVSIEKTSRKTFKGFVDNALFRNISADTKERIYLKRWENIDKIINEHLIQPFIFGDDKRMEIKEKIVKHME